MRSHVVVITVMFLTGCTARMYAGPRRPKAEVALIHIDGTRVTRVDGQRAKSDRLEVLPGIHAVAVALDDHRSPGGAVVCFAAHAGHAYRARRVYAGHEWRPEIVDETRAELVRSWPIDPRGEHC